MFKFPLKRHHNNNTNNQNHHSKSASSRSNEGFIFIRCGHNANSNNISSYSNNNNAINNIYSKNVRSISNNNNNANVAKSTVQTSWRPQLPLPKEVHLSNANIQRNHHHHLQHHQHQQEDDDINEIQIIESDMERFHLSSKKESSLNGSQLSNASQSGSNSKKWSFGRLFRRKKEIESESSSEDDRKAGFMPNPQKYNRNGNNSITSANTSTPVKKSTKTAKTSNRGSKLIGSGFDHIVLSPATGNSTSAMQQQHHVDNEFFLPVETVPQQEPYYQNNLTAQQQHLQQQQHRLHHSQQYLPHVPQTQQQLLSRSAHSLDRRSAKAKQRSIQKLSNGLPTTKKASSSEEEEIISLNSSTFSKYRSDESIHSGGQSLANGQSRRSRAARNERYYKRLSRDGEVSHGQVPVMYAQQPTQRWKTQPVPLSIYQAPQQQQAVPQQPQMRSSQQTAQYPKLRNTSSLQHMAPYVQWGQMQQQQPKNLQNSVNDSKRSISYDSHIHLQNASGRQLSKPLPPPPPPRDPMRRVNVSSVGLDGSSGDLRPISYAFDQTGVPVLPTSGLNGRCVSDDKIWAQQPHYQSIHSLNIAPQQGSAHQQHANQPNRRFITRAERDAHPGKKSLPNGLDFHYVADATPRSRNPIHILDQTAFGEEIQDSPTTGILRTTKSGLPTSPTKVQATEFWKRLEGAAQNISNTATPVPAPRGRDIQKTTVVNNSMKPRSVSTSRVGELKAYPMPLYSEVFKPKQNIIKPSVSPNNGADEVDAVVCGSLHIKPSQDNTNSYVEIRNKDINKANSMPNHYQRRSGELPTTPNKYEEYVNEKRGQHHNPLFDAPQPPQRKLSGVPNIPQLSFPRKKPANLEEAINELEAIYRSLGLTEPEPEIKKERVPTPNDFEKYALTHADEYDDEDSPAGEPDPIRDDVAYRNIKLANLHHKSVEKQPPFGIPVGPIVPAAQTDYLHVTPKRKELLLNDSKAPDVIIDDLAVRALRKDPHENKEKFHYPYGSLVKKNRATRTQSANIYALIQRDAAKPSGGDLRSFLELTKNIDRSGSMSDLHKNDSNNDVPTTLKLLQSLREQDKEQLQMKKSHQQIPFRHPSQGGAICQLPEKLSCASSEENKSLKPIPLPRKTLTPEPQHHTDTHKMEEALNKIAQDAQESSIKLTKELNELRKEAFITAYKPKRTHNEAEDEKLVKELQEIEQVSEAAKKCGKMLLDTLPDASKEGDDEETLVKPLKLHKEDKLIKAIDQVSEAANKVCEKILKDIVTTEPPVIVQEAVKVTQMPKEIIKSKETSSLIMPTLIKKLDPIQSNNIEAIARRCMRQLSDLADNHDYDNLNQPELAVATTCNMDMITKDEITNDNMTTSNLTETRKPPKPKPQQPHLIDDIDQIMKECEDQVRQQEIKEKKQRPIMAKPHIQAPTIGGGSSTTTASSFSSSSDCLAKSSSPSGSRRFSSSITSFNPYSSSDYIKSPSSDFHAPSTDPIKTFSTTSYDVQSTTSATPNLTTNSTFSYSPSPPPLNLTPISNCSATIASNTQRGRSSSPSQYNSSEELAMIFGIEEKSKTAKKLQNNSGNPENTPNSQKELLPEETLTKAASLKIANYDNSECCSKTNDCLLLLTPNTCCSHTNKASSPTSSSSPSSSLSSRLETIPELCLELKGYKEEDKAPLDKDSQIKLSPNFNRIYASKLQISVDKLLKDQQSSTPQLLSLCDSLSSLEETSSNPDSGNVSLADFPLVTQNVNNSLLLNSTFNSRFEVRNCFKTEISIETLSESELKSEESILSNDNERDLASEEEFPPPPTEEELEESLKENTRDRYTIKEKFISAKINHELMGERIILAREEIMAEVKALEEKALKRAKELREENETSNSILGDNSIDIKEEESFSENYNSLKSDINDSLDIKNVKNSQRKRSFVMETPLLEMNILEERINYEININNEETSSEASLPYDQENATVSSLGTLAFNCYELTKALEEENDAQKFYEKAEDINDIKKVLSLQNLAHNCYESNKALVKETEKQKLSKTKDEQKEALNEIKQEEFKKALSVNKPEGKFEKVIDKKEQEQLKKAFNESDRELLNENKQKLEQTWPEHDKSQQQSCESKKDDVEQANQELRVRVWQPSPYCSNELPSTSSKSTSSTTTTVVNVLGEQRQAVNGLTLLEHLVVACTLGLINTNDLFTLCLIIIGIIIVIAIALF